MFDFLKRLVSRHAGDGVVTARKKESGPTRAPKAPPPKQIRPGTAPAPAANKAVPSVSEESIRLPLRHIVHHLPDTVKELVQQQPGGGVQISIPLSKVLPQLARGSVRLTLAELRALSPGGVFPEKSELDTSFVELPLSEVLAQVKPTLLARRPNQKKVEVPEEVTPVFDSKGRPLAGVRVAPTTSAAVVTPPPAPRAEPEPRPAPAPPPSPAARPAAAPAPIPAPALKIGPSAAPATPSIKMPAPTPAAGPAAACVAPAPAPPVTPASTETISVGLAQVMAGWPDPVKQALVELNAAEAAIRCPANELEAALRKGKVVFPWQRVRTWIQPPPTASAHAGSLEATLEFPLAVIAPLFMARRKAPSAQKKVAVNQDIPDVFAAKTRAAAPAPAAAPTAAPAAPAAPAPPQEIGEVFGQPGRKNWSPAEIVQKTSQLQGVAGALIAMQDGLLVASHLPQGLNADTVAAFLPQMFTRVAQYSKELRFDDPTKLTLIVDQISFKVFKVGGVYFCVLGRAQETLPEPQLSIIAAQLAPAGK